MTCISQGSATSHVTCSASVYDSVLLAHKRGIVIASFLLDKDAKLAEDCLLASRCSHRGDDGAPIPSKELLGVSA